MSESFGSPEVVGNKREGVSAFYGTVKKIEGKDPNVYGKLVESKIPFSEGDAILRHEIEGYNEGTTAGVYSLLRKGETTSTEFYTTSEYA